MAAPDSSRRSAYAAALRYLSVRARTVKETEERLASKGFESADVKAVVESLIDDGYLDDARMAREVAASRSSNRRWGPARIRHELSRRGVAPETVKEALVPYGGPAEAEAAEAALKSWLRKNGLKADGIKKDRKALARAFRHLASKGFGPAASGAALKRAGAEVEAAEAE